MCNVSQHQSQYQDVNRHLSGLVGWSTGSMQSGKAARKNTDSLFAPHHLHLLGSDYYGPNTILSTSETVILPVNLHSIFQGGTHYYVHFIVLYK